MRRSLPLPWQSKAILYGIPKHVTNFHPSRQFPVRVKLSKQGEFSRAGSGNIVGDRSGGVNAVTDPEFGEAFAISSSSTGVYLGSLSSLFTGYHLSRT